MQYSVEEIKQYAAEEDVKFIRMAFCDAAGRQKNIAIMPEELDRAFQYGIAIDGSAIPGFGGEVHSDLLLRPDPSTLCVLPWRPEHGRVVRMFCAVTQPDGTVIGADARSLLKKTVEDDKGENVRREVCLTLERMGIRPESSHHEEGPGQNEIDFRYADPVTAADNAVTFRTAVDTVAARNGLYADFGPKPLADKAGNGMHINFSVVSEDKRDVMPQVLAGVLAHVEAMTAFLNPTEESYRRFGSWKAPGYLSWSAENRSQLIRVPAAEGEYRRAELRSPDPLCNPYLAFVLLIRAGMEGVAHNMQLPPAADLNLYTAPEEIRARYRRLPETWAEAKAAAAASDFIREHLPAAIIQYYT